MKQIYVKMCKEWVLVNKNKEGRERNREEIKLMIRSNIRAGREIKVI